VKALIASIFAQQFLSNANHITTLCSIVSGNECCRHVFDANHYPLVKHVTTKNLSEAMVNRLTACHMGATKVSFRHLMQHTSDNPQLLFQRN
jgi:hypothetical protein